MYDGDGGRVRVSRTADNETRTTTYIGSLFEKDDCTDSGNQITQIKHVFAGSTRVCSIKSVAGGSADINYYHGDHLGSSSIVTDQNGQQVQHLEYAPYGSVSKNEGVDVTDYKFTGKELDATGLYFYSARYYDPEIGRFVSADTVVQAPYDPQSLNRYSYCRNNPLNYMDPSGHFWFIIIGAILGAISAAVNDQPVWQGLLLGALGAGLIGAGATAASSLWGPAWAFVGASAGGAASGAINGAAYGGDIGMNALVGGIGAGIGCGLGYSAGDQFWPGFAAAVLGGAGSGAIGAAIFGGDLGQSAWMGVAYSSVGYLANRVAESGNRKPKTETEKQTEQKRAANLQQTLDAAREEGGVEGQLKTAAKIAAVSENKFIRVIDSAPSENWLNVNTEGKYFNHGLYWGDYTSSMIQSGWGLGVGVIVAAAASFPFNLLAGAAVVASSITYAVDAARRAWVPIYGEQQYHYPVIKNANTK
jgi:RHS repeat-associated protein